jgi:hypothetical protein
LCNKISMNNRYWRISFRLFLCTLVSDWLIEEAGTFLNSFLLLRYFIILLPFSYWFLFHFSLQELDCSALICRCLYFLS